MFIISLAFSGNVTIYYYESDQVDENEKGVPVVLNFTNTNKYLHCSKTENGVNISVMVRSHVSMPHVGLFQPLLPLIKIYILSVVL